MSGDVASHAWLRCCHARKQHPKAPASRHETLAPRRRKRPQECPTEDSLRTHCSAPLPLHRRRPTGACAPAGLGGTPGRLETRPKDHPPPAALSEPGIPRFLGTGDDSDARLRRRDTARARGRVSDPRRRHEPPRRRRDAAVDRRTPHRHARASGPVVRAQLEGAWPRCPCATFHAHSLSGPVAETTRPPVWGRRPKPPINSCVAETTRPRNRIGPARVNLCHTPRPAAGAHLAAQPGVDARALQRHRLQSGGSTARSTEGLLEGGGGYWRRLYM